MYTMKMLCGVMLLLLNTSVAAAVFLVGPGMPYETPSAAAANVEDGDTVEIEAGDYNGDVAVWTQDNLTIRGVGGRPHMLADGNAAEAKAIWVIKGDNTVVENIEFSGASVEDQNGAGIRFEGTNLTVRECHFHDNENGILTGANPDSEILIEFSVFERNGFGDGYSHNMYIGRVARFTLQFSYVRLARVGHQVKSRAIENHILFNRLMDEQYGDSSYLIDLPEPGYAFVIGNEMQQGPRAENWALINSAQNLVLINNTLVNDRHSGLFVRLSEESGESLLQNNLFVGNGSLETGDADRLTNQHIDDAELVGRSNFNYRLDHGSPAINQGSAVDSSWYPASALGFEYRHVAGQVVRQYSGKVDVGAHEYSEK